MREPCYANIPFLYVIESYSGTIPKCIENGEYLLRVQQLAIHNPWPAGIPQFYISCGEYSHKTKLSNTYGLS